MHKFINLVIEICICFIPIGVILFLLRSFTGITFSLWSCMGIGVLTIALFAVTHALHKGLYWFSICALIIAYTGFIHAYGGEMYQDVVYAIPNIVLSAERARDITTTMLFFTSLLCALSAFFEYSLSLHGILSMGLLAIIVLLLVTGAELSIPAVLLLLVFFVVFAIRKTIFKEGKTITFSSITKKRITACILCGLLAVTIIFLVFSSLFSSPLSSLAYTAEGWVSRTLQDISGIGDLPEATGQINYGNNYKTGETELTLVTTEQPTETMYICGFTGKDYYHGNWTYDTEEEAISQVAENMQFSDYTNWIRGIYGSMFFSMNYDTNWDARRTRRQMIVYYANDNMNYHGFFTPYYTNVTYGNVFMQDDGYGLQYFEQNEMDVNWARAEENRYYGIANRVRLEYRKVIQNVYTTVPADGLERLKTLCNAQNISTFEEATAFIQQYFMKHLTYSTTPGRTPINEDIVETFLFDSRTGYCQHYASAAVLMYRLFGIPCRYVAGYVVQPNDFVRLDNGRWEADVPDTSAHAWAEVFDENIGWTPVDLTPDNAGNVVPEYPGMEFELPVIEQPAEQSQAIETPGTKEQGTPQTTEQREERSPYPIFIVLIAVGAVFFVYAWKKKRNIEDKDVTHIFQSILAILHHEKLMVGYTGTEEDFVKALSQELQDINQSDIEKMMDIVYRTAFSNKPITEEETFFVDKMYKTIRNAFATKAKGIHRLYYWKKD